MNTTLGELVSDPSGFLDQPAKQIFIVRGIGIFGGLGWLARYRIIAIMAKMSITRDVALPSISGGGVIIEAASALGGVEAVFDRPALAFDGSE